MKKVALAVDSGYIKSASKVISEEGKPLFSFGGEGGLLFCEIILDIFSSLVMRAKRKGHVSCHFRFQQQDFLLLFVIMICIGSSLNLW